MTLDDLEELKERVDAFNRLQLPNEPQALAEPPDQLVNDLWQKIEELADEMQKLLVE